MPKRAPASAWRRGTTVLHAAVSLAPTLAASVVVSVAVALAALGTGAPPASAQPVSTTSVGAPTTTSSIVPSLGTAATPTPTDPAGSTTETLAPASGDRPLTTSEQRLEWLDKAVIGGFVVLSIVVVLVRQRRSPLARGDRYARDNLGEDDDAADRDQDGDGDGDDDGDGDGDVVLDLRDDDRDPRRDAGR